MKVLDNDGFVHNVTKKDIAAECFENLTDYINHKCNLLQELRKRPQNIDDDCIRGELIAYKAILNKIRFM